MIAPVETTTARSAIRLCLAIAVLTVGLWCGGALAQGGPAKPAPASPTQQDEPQAEPAPAPQPAAEPRPVAGVDLNGSLAGWTSSLDRIEKGLANEGVRARALDFYRNELEAIREAAQKFAAEIKPRLDAAQAQMESLGPAPGENQPPEPEAVARQRESLNANWSALSGALRSAEATALRASQLITKIQDIRRRNFAERLFERVPGLFTFEVWRDLPVGTTRAFATAYDIVKTWWNRLDSVWDVIQITALSLVFWAGLQYLARLGVDRFRDWRQIEPPPFWKRASSAAWVVLMRTLPTPAASLFFFFALRLNGLLSPRIDAVLQIAVIATIIVSVVNALATTIFAVNRPQWRIFALPDDAAKRIRWLMVALAGVYALDLVTGRLNELAATPFLVTVAQGFLACLAFSGLVIAMLTSWRDGPPLEGAQSSGWLRALRLPLWIAAFLILLTAMLGYVALSRFIAAQVIVTGTILALLYLLLLWVEAFGQSIRDEHAPAGRWLKERIGFDERRREQLAVPVTLVLKLVSIVLAVPPIMLQWGFDAKDVSDLFGRLLFGFRIGNVEISFATIIASIIVFILGYTAAKIVQGWLDRQVLARSGLAGGTRESIRTGVGYLGIFAAGIVAFSYAGVDLSSLAIVAGAFSVGIGFGLQSIINNFVSGLILLAERPIKVGDWVVVGGEEGFVRRISVRSTEIETFDRASVIVPNSYFITETVKNWTFSNNIGRVVIPVGVSYDADPEQVRDLLLQVARNHPLVMSDPAPFVFFEDFGASSLDFKLFAFVYNITSSLGIRTELRIAILKTFREHGIEIPFRQTEVTLRGIEWLKDALAERRGKPPGVQDG